ncbi:hypothetical protein ACMZKT_07145, partial [Klebsiella pneumoniae]
KSAQIREILISESAWEEMTCLFAPSLMYFGIQGHDKSWPFYLSLSRANDKNLLIKNSRPVFGCGK